MMIEQISILIVDDNHEKLTDIVKTLRSYYTEKECQIKTAVDYDTARDCLRDSYYNLVILDLKLPYNGAPTIEASQALLQQINEGSLCAATHVVGITAYAESRTELIQFYEERLLSILMYEVPANATWRKTLKSKIKYIRDSHKASLSQALNSYDYDLLVLTTRKKNEFDAVNSVLFTSKNDYNTIDDGSIGYGINGLLQLSNKSLRTLHLCAGEMGSSTAAAMASQAILRYRPKIVAMLGMCCGFKHEKCPTPKKLGDVIIAKEAIPLEEGKHLVDEKKQEKLYRNRAKPIQLADELSENIDRWLEDSHNTVDVALQKFMKLQRNKKLIETYGDQMNAQPKVNAAPIVSAPSVIADEDKILEIMASHTRAVGLDMEIYGVYKAAKISYGKKPMTVAIKGVSDFGDPDKFDQLQPFASQASAEVLKSLLESFDI